MFKTGKIKAKMIVQKFFLAVIAVLVCHLGFAQKLTSYVDPFIGTGAVDGTSLSGSNFPGATVPFGFVQLSPDTDNEVFSPASGYNYNDKTIVGFSHTHLSGTGVADLFDVLLMPVSGNIKWTPGEENKPASGYRSAFSHQQETARPGYYQVNLLDYNINAELTATEHAGFHRYTYNGDGPARIMVDLDHSLSKKRDYWVCRILGSEIRKVDDYTIEGYRIITGWARMRRVYFHARFSKPISSHEMAWGGHSIINKPVINGADIVRAAFNFDVKKGEQVLVKVGLSPVSVNNARENLNSEIKGWDFDAVAKRANALWEKELSNIRIDAADDVKKIFYTGLYHLYIQPNNTADVNGEYQGSDMEVKKSLTKKHYSTFSLWDTYRAAHPLYTLLKPSKDAEFINSLVQQYESYGYLPIWQLWNDENYCMIGNHSIPVIVDAVVKGVKGFNPEKAYEAVKNSSLTDHPGSPFKYLQQYGYFPENLESQSVSKGLEIAFNDWCVAQFAKKLGKKEDYNFFMNRASYIKNIYDSKTGFFRGKNKDGKWLEPFDPLQYGGNGGNPYTEGNAWQYLWYVPHDVPGMIDLFGGREKFISKLDKFFTTAGGEDAKNENASGFIGQYAHGNEPSHHIAYLYNYAGQPWKTQQRVAEIMDKFYTTDAAGYSGNEDCGQMSAWYIFSAMGFYPVNPANGVYDIGSPRLNKAIIDLENGKQFTVTAHNAGGKNMYVQSVSLNGAVYNKNYILHSDILKGGRLVFEMGPSPSYGWAKKAITYK